MKLWHRIPQFMIFNLNIKEDKFKWLKKWIEGSKCHHKENTENFKYSLKNYV